MRQNSAPHLADTPTLLAHIGKACAQAEAGSFAGWCDRVRSMCPATALVPAPPASTVPSGVQQGAAPASRSPRPASSPTAPPVSEVQTARFSALTQDRVSASSADTPRVPLAASLPPAAPHPAPPPASIPNASHPRPLSPPPAPASHFAASLPPSLVISPIIYPASLRSPTSSTAATCPHASTQPPPICSCLGNPQRARPRGPRGPTRTRLPRRPRWHPCMAPGTQQ